MNTSKLVLPVLTLFVFVNSTFGQDAKPEPTNLGASLSGPFYRRGDHEPFAGFVVDVRTLQMAVSKSLKGDVTVEQLRKLLDPTKLQAAMDPKNEASVQNPMWVMRRDLPIRTRPYYWSSFNENSGKITIVFYNRMEDLDSPQPFEERGLQSFEAAKQSVNQVEKMEVQNLTAEQESFIEAKKVDGYAPEQRYQLGFRLEAYAEKILGEGSFVAPGREVIWQENLVDETEVERSNLRLEGTRTFDFSSNLTKKESPLVAIDPFTTTLTQRRSSSKTRTQRWRLVNSRTPIRWCG